VITRGIKEFVARDWQAARDRKDAYWGERIARLGPLEAFRIADQLRRQAMHHDPAWPDAALRQTIAEAAPIDPMVRPDYESMKPEAPEHS